MAVLVPQAVSDALRLEAARRSVNRNTVHMKDVHREWLEQRAADVLKSS